MSRSARAVAAAAALLLASGACKSEEDDWVPIVPGSSPERGRAGSTAGRSGSNETSGSESGGRPTPPPSPPPAPPPSTGPVADDPLNRGDIAFMRGRAREVLRELVAALPAAQRQDVAQIPLVVDDRPGQVNAFAACAKNGASAMAITDGLMRIQANMARAQASDEVFGTRVFDAYVAHVARTNTAAIPAGLLSAAQDQDGRKVARQHQLFDEELAFVLGHELAHHYLSHTGCIGKDRTQVTAADLGRVLTSKVPVFNQANEILSDTYGTHNALTAGSRRSGYRWNEGGAMLTLKFFLALRTARGGGGELFDFESTHPHPNVRIPVVERAASTFRATGGMPLPVIPLPSLQ